MLVEYTYMYQARIYSVNICTLCFIIGVTHFQNSSYRICLKQISIAASHFKAMTNWDTLSIAFFDGRHYIGAITKFLSLPRELKCVSSMIVN